MLVFLGRLKRVYGKLVEGMMMAGNNHIDEDFLYLYPSAREAVFLPRNICNGFAGAGLKPLDQDWVLEKITFQLHTQTPPLLIEGSISPVLQTPQNPCQIDCKVQIGLQEVFKRKGPFRVVQFSYPAS